VVVREEEAARGPVQEVSLYSNGRPVIRYLREPDSGQLVMDEVLADKNRPGDKLGFTAVGGIDDHIEGRFFVFVEKVADSDKVCVLRKSPLSLTLLRTDCSGEGEVMLSCSEDSLEVEGMTCRRYKEWLKVRVEPAAMVWQVQDAQPYTMWVRSKATDGSRMRGVTLCTDQGGPDCSDIYCAPGVDAQCLLLRNICRFGTGPCSRLDWLYPDQATLEDPCDPPCQPGFFEPCTYGVCEGRRYCRWEEEYGRGCWSSCRPNQRIGPERCDTVDNDCDGEIDENPDVFAVDHTILSRRNICDDDDICTRDECDGTHVGACLHSPEHFPYFGPSCADIVCRSDDEALEVVPHDERCVTDDDFCEDCFSEQCACPSFDYCNPEADITSNPTGCEKLDPCNDGIFCTTHFCVDYTDQYARAQCNEYGNADLAIKQIDYCMFGPGTKACDLSLELDNPCCQAATENIELPLEDIGLLFACLIWASSGTPLAWLTVLLCPPEPWDFVDPEVDFPECSNPLSRCPEGDFKWVHHPRDGTIVAYVYCSGYTAMHDCDIGCDDGCNEAYCNFDTSECDIRLPHDSPYGYEGCNDGLSCTTEEKCLRHSYSEGYYGRFCEFDYWCRQEDPGDDCDIPFCTPYWQDGLPGIDGTDCRESCGDIHGKGNPSAIRHYPSPGAWCEAYDEYIPPGNTEPHSGCSMIINHECHNVLPDQAGACKYIECDEEEDRCFLQNIICSDGFACTWDLCGDPGGCYYPPNDGYCINAHPYERNCKCDPENRTFDDGCKCEPIY